MAYAAPRQFTDIDALVVRAAAACGVAALELSRRFGPGADGKPLLSRQTADKIIKRQSYRMPYRMLPSLRDVFVCRPVLITEHRWPKHRIEFRNGKNEHVETGEYTVRTSERYCEPSEANFYEFKKGDPGPDLPGTFDDVNLWNEALQTYVLQPKFWRYAKRIDARGEPHEAESDAAYMAGAREVTALLPEYIEHYRAARDLPPHIVEPTRRELKVWRENERERKADDLDAKRMRKAAQKWRYNPANPTEVERRRKIKETHRRKVYGENYVPNYEETIKCPPVTPEMWAELVAQGVNQGPNWTDPPPDIKPGEPVGWRFRKISFEGLRRRRRSFF